MAEYLVVYLGGNMPATPEEGEEEMQKWGAYMAQYGDKFRDPGNPVGKSYTLSQGGTDEGSPNPIMGYGILNAESIDEAIAIARDCPHLGAGGTIEVAEIIPIEM